MLPQLQIETLQEALELWIPYYIPKSKEIDKLHFSINIVHFDLMKNV